MSEKCNGEFTCKINRVTPGSDYDEIEPKLYYENVARFKQQCNKDFKCFLIDQLRPIDHLGIIITLCRLVYIIESR